MASISAQPAIFPPATILRPATVVHPAIRHTATAGRLLMGLVFFVCGLNGFFDFLPHPTEPMPAGAMALTVGFFQAGYMFPLIAGTQALVGALLLANRLVPLALIVIAPVIVNIVAFHLFLAPSGLVLALVLLAIECYLAWTYRSVYRPLFALRAVAGAR
jgi:hypothetical protein